MAESLGVRWRSVFWETLQKREHAESLKQAALAERLAEWTAELTTIAVETCEALGWQACGRGHKLELLPVPGCEYLSLDVMAFADAGARWPFPIAVFEFENSPDDDRIAYSLWKVLCIKAPLRAVFCYRASSEQGPALLRKLREDVIGTMSHGERMEMAGETLIVVGNRAEAETFPYGFFKWWVLEKNTGTFQRFE